MIDGLMCGLGRRGKKKKGGGGGRGDVCPHDFSTDPRRCMHLASPMNEGLARVKPTEKRSRTASTYLFATV